jgi:hypothetical protein
MQVLRPDAVKRILEECKALRDVLESLHLFLLEWDSLTERLPDVFTMDDAVRPPLIPM